MGCLWANYLAGAGADVHLLLRSQERLMQWQQLGGVAYSHEGQSTIVPCSASLLSDVEAFAPIQQLLISCKTYQTPAALDAVALSLAPNARILLVQNGMGSHELLRARFPEACILCCSSTDGAFLEAPLSLVHAGIGENWLGVYHGSVDKSLLDFLTNLDTSRFHISDAIETRLWRKLAINCAINGLTAIHRCRNGELLEHSDWREEVVALCVEVERVSAALGLELGLDLGETDLQEQVFTVLRTTAANYSSMYQDATAGRTTEIEAINGYLLAKADRLGIDCPANRALLSAVRSLGGS